MLPHATENPFFVLDASAWVSRLVSQDEFHAAVKSWMEEQREAGVQFISPALLQELAPDILRHRLGLTYEAEAEEITTEQIIGQIIERTPVPAA